MIVIVSEPTIIFCEGVIKFIIMSCITIANNHIVVARGLRIDFYDYSDHKIIDIPKLKQHENDHISDITSSTDGKYIAIMTSSTKKLIVYDLPLLENHKIFILPRSASKIRFTPNNRNILVADKSGDVLLYDVNSLDTGSKLLGHLSLLLDVLQTKDENFIISSDRDEKIRVSCYPNTYNIQTYCLGHMEFVNHVEVLPHNDNFIISTSGDGTVKVWELTEGKLCYTIDTYLAVNDTQLKENFIKVMEAEGVEVNNLPIVHFTVTKVNETSSILAVSVHTYNILLIYSLNKVDNKFNHKIQDKIKLEDFPTDIKFHNSNLFVYYDSSSKIVVLNMLHYNGKTFFELAKEIQVFEDSDNGDSQSMQCNFEYIKVMYKRKFDNVQEYQERKKQRLEKSL